MMSPKSLSEKQTNDTVGTRSSLSAWESSRDNRMLRFVEDMERLLLNAKFADVTLRAEGRDIGAHRGILSVRSSVFDCMFEDPMPEGQDGRVDIEDMAFDTLQRLVAYMYTSRVTDPLTYESAMALFTASDKYDVCDLRDICAEVILRNLSVENCVDVLMLADIHGDAPLKEASAAFLADHFKEIWQRPDNSKRIGEKPDLMKELLDVLCAGDSDSD